MLQRPVPSRAVSATAAAPVASSSMMPIAGANIRDRRSPCLLVDPGVGVVLALVERERVERLHIRRRLQRQPGEVGGPLGSGGDPEGVVLVVVGRDRDVAGGLARGSSTGVSLVRQPPRRPDTRMPGERQLRRGREDADASRPRRPVAPPSSTPSRNTVSLNPSAVAMSCSRSGRRRRAGDDPQLVPVRAPVVGEDPDHHYLDRLIHAASLPRTRPAPPSLAPTAPRRSALRTSARQSSPRSPLRRRARLPGSS